MNSRQSDDEAMCLSYTALAALCAYAAFNGYCCDWKAHCSSHSVITFCAGDILCLKTQMNYMHKHAIMPFKSAIKRIRQAINKDVAQQDSLFMSNTADSLAFECNCLFNFYAGYTISALKMQKHVACTSISYCGHSCPLGLQQEQAVSCWSCLAVKGMSVLICQQLV